MNNRKLLIIVGILSLLLLPILIGKGTFLMYLINLGCIFAIVAIGLNLLVGLTGQISLGHSAFVAVGAYVSAYLTLELNLPFFTALPLSGVVSALLGVCLGFPALRLSGPYLAIATLGFGVAVSQILANWESFTGGFSGLKPPVPYLFGFFFDTEKSFYYIIIISLVLLAWFAKNIIKSKVGRALISIRDSEIAAQAMGVNLRKYKLMAFAISAFFAGIGGSLYAHMVGYISPTNFTLVMSINFLTMIVIGGMTSISGGILGALFITWLPYVIEDLSRYLPSELLNVAKTLPQVLNGVILILIVIYMPMGLINLINNGRFKVKRQIIQKFKNNN